MKIDALCLSNEEDAGGYLVFMIWLTDIQHAMLAREMGTGKMGMGEGCMGYDGCPPPSLMKPGVGGRSRYDPPLLSPHICFYY